ncbi:sporulation integral membrane protein YtvI [Bacillus sp. FJAT-49705]|uniref:Sporulation integral membrane protein YtvI n=1 Tax=Cytobacillus citreus TaxID=2833586 RepID=A0ABS5NUS6_9BACI|nr:sporulation integral membrane protein YtvI [Cytobacillus citreus]MBS4191580.1 sporulation integral membrane protein YtvI [Cytobacillus citreus]
MNPIYINRTIRFLIVIGCIVLFFMSFFYLSKLTYPFIIAFAIAFLINPLVNFLQHKCRIPRGLSVVISLVLLISIFAGLITLLIVEIVSGTEYLAKVVPDHLDTLIDYTEQFFAAQIIPLYNKITSIFVNLGTGQQDTILANIESVGKEIGSTVGAFIQDFFGKIPKIISWFPNAGSVLIFSLLGTFFISKDWYRLSTLGSKLIPNRAKKSGITVFLDLKKALFGFIKAQATLISLTTVIILIGLLILRIDYAITIALITGIIDVIPYLGTGLVFVPWIIYEAITGDIGMAIGLGVLYTIVLVQRQIMEPKILSSSIGLDPLATLIALFIGFKLIGFLGLIVGPVTLVIITTLHKANVFRDIWAFIKGSEA